MPKVVITDWTFPDLSVEEGILKNAGVELEARGCKTESELIALCADADAVITQFARVNAAVIQAMRQARAIVRYGIGVDNVDLEAARTRGIPVCNVPDYCIDEVADQTMAFILALTRQVVPHARKLSSGGWGLATPISGMKALRDLTVGVLGYGRIGREVVRRLSAFKCRVLVCDPLAKRAEITALGGIESDWETLLAESDILTLHCPSTAQTRRIVGRESIGKMKAGAMLVNASRGDLVDPEALVEALRSGKLAGAALDVFDPEPIPADHPVRGFEQVILAPHIASCSVPAVRKLRETVARLAVAAVRGERLATVVNGVTQG